jgi:hypothetical protein
MPMNSTYLAAIAGHGVGLITHIGLTNAAGTELSGGGYARQAVTWTGSGGTRSPSADIVFDVAADSEVGQWRGYSASSGGTDYGGAVVTTRNYTNAGTYTLLAGSTNIAHTAT